jgi:hypothetical protein
MGFKKWTPFTRGRLGLGHDFHRETVHYSNERSSTWGVYGNLNYVFLLNDAFAELSELSSSKPYFTPSLQQWNLLSESDVSFEIIRGNSPETSVFDTYRLKIWQTLPRSWRFVGGLRHTRDAELAGITILASFNSQRWSGSIGFGRAMIATDKIVASFFYPTAEISYVLGNLPLRQVAGVNGMLKQ